MAIAAIAITMTTAAIAMVASGGKVNAVLAGVGEGEVGGAGEGDGPGLGDGEGDGEGVGCCVGEGDVSGAVTVSVRVSEFVVFPSESVILQEYA